MRPARRPRSGGYAGRRRRRGSGCPRGRGRRTGAARVALDLTMPVMDGWAFRAAQLCDATLASIPVIVLSAVGRAAVAAAAEAMRAIAGVAKPADGDELLRLVDTHSEPRSTRPAPSRGNGACRRCPLAAGPSSSSAGWRTRFSSRTACAPWARSFFDARD